MKCFLGTGRRAVTWAAACVFGVAGANICAARQTSQAVAVSGDVTNSCVVKSADVLSFGLYTPFSASPLLASGNIALNCTKNTVVVVAPISGGGQMIGGGGVLHYDLYTDAALSLAWGQPSFITGTLDMNSNANIYYSTLTKGIDRAQCSALAGGTLYGWYAAYNNCYTNFSTTPTAGSNSVSTAPRSVYYDDGTLIKEGSAGISGIYFYIPNGSIKVGSGYTYTVALAGNGQNVLSAVSPTAQNTMELTYYGRVRAQQDLPPGSYTDTVVFRVQF